MEEYLQRKAERAQNYLVNARMPMSIGPSIYFWTHRVTSTDVISMVTTSMPASIEGLDTMGLDIDREKDLVLTKTESNTGGPLRMGKEYDEVEHQRKCEELWSEREAFMKRLNASRKTRVDLEMGAAVRLQACFRGYQARQQVPYLKRRLEVRKKVWVSLRIHLERTGWETSKTAYIAGQQEQWRRAALTLQNAYRITLAQRALKRKRKQFQEDKKLAAVKCMQNWVRTYFAVHYTDRERSRHFHDTQAISAQKIQCSWRRFTSHRTVAVRRLLFRVVCAIAIQCAWRRYLGAKCVHERRERLRFEEETCAVIIIQKRARGMLGRGRAAMIKEVSEVNTAFAAVVKIQRQLRCLQARQKIVARRFRRSFNVRLCLAVQVQRIVRGFIARKRFTRIKDMNEFDIFALARKDKQDMMQILIEGDYGYSKSDKDARGYTVLMVAAMEGNLNTVRKCLALGWSANVTKSDDGQTTAAHLAVEKGHTEVAEYIVQRGDFDLNKHGKSLVLTAAKHGRKSLLQVLLNRDRALCVEACYKKGTILHQAVFSGSRESILLLMNELQQQELDIDQQDENGRTALHLAVMLPSKDVVQVLLNAGASVRIKDNHGFVPAVLAGLYGTEEVATLVIRNSPDEEEMFVKQWVHDEDILAVIKLAEQGRAAMLERAFLLGFPVDSVFWETGDTIAIAACRSKKPGNKLCADICKKFKCNFRLSNNEGQTALHAAARRPDILAMLLDSPEISPKEMLATDIHGVTPLMLYCEEGGDLEPLVDLLEKDQVNMKDNNGLTALHYAAKGFKLEVVKQLIQMGALASETDNNFRTPMHHCACSSGAKLNYLSRDFYSKMVTELRKAGGNLTVPDINNATPLAVALEEGSWLLLEQMASKLQHKDCQNFAFECIKYHSTQAMKSLMKYCEEYKIHEWKNKDHLSLIGAAIKEDDIKMVAYLLDECHGPFSPSLLHLAAYHGCDDVLRFFQETGRLDSKILEKRVQGFSNTHADPNPEGDTVFMAALRGGQIETAWWLYWQFKCKVKPALSFHCSGWIIAIARQEKNNEKLKQASILSPFNRHEDSVSIVYFQNLEVNMPFR